MGDPAQLCLAASVTEFLDDAGVGAGPPLLPSLAKASPGGAFDTFAGAGDAIGSRHTFTSKTSSP
jgi:hypothetical protein